MGQFGAWNCGSHPGAWIHRAYLALDQAMSLNPMDWCWGQPGTWAIKYGHEAGPGSTGASLVLSLLTPKSMGVGLVPGIIGEGLKPESTGMSLTPGL